MIHFKNWILLYRNIFLKKLQALSRSIDIFNKTKYNLVVLPIDLSIIQQRLTL